MGHDVAQSVAVVPGSHSPSPDGKVLVVSTGVPDSEAAGAWLDADGRPELPSAEFDATSLAPGTPEEPSVCTPTDDAPPADVEDGAPPPNGVEPTGPWALVQDSCPSDVAPFGTLCDSECPQLNVDASTRMLVQHRETPYEIGLGMGWTSSSECECHPSLRRSRRLRVCLLCNPGLESSVRARPPFAHLAPNRFPAPRFGALPLRSRPSKSKEAAPLSRLFASAPPHGEPALARAEPCSPRRCGIPHADCSDDPGRSHCRRRACRARDPGRSVGPERCHDRPTIERPRPHDVG